MAGTPVRSLRESFDRMGSRAIPSRPGPVFQVEPWMEREGLLLAFVAVQAATCAALILRDALDLGIAACLSSGLITAAGVYASRRAGLAAEAGGRAASRRVAAAMPSLNSGAAPVSTLPRLAPEPAQATEAWADLMARISHEIRTPLNAVIGFSDLMEREIFGPLGHVRYGDYAIHIKDSGEALLKSAEDTLALSSLLAAPKPCERPQITNLGELIAEAWRPLELSGERRGVRLDVNMATHLDVAGERRVIRQAILNLLTEAQNRTADGGTISIGASVAGDAARLTITTQTAARWRHEMTPSLAVCLARALLERTGSALTITGDNAAHAWQAVTVLDRPVQDDFFPGPH